MIKLEYIPSLEIVLLAQNRKKNKCKKAEEVSDWENKGGSRDPRQSMVLYVQLKTCAL